MNKIYTMLLSITLTLIAPHVVANEKYCDQIEVKISLLDKHADNYYSLANYQFNDEKLISDLRKMSHRLKDSSLARVLDSVEVAIKNNDKELMMKMAPLSRYLNDWNSAHCS